MANILMDEVIQQLEKQTIETTVMQFVETITLVSDSDDYEHGFKIYYNDLWEPLFMRYFTVSLIPNKDKRYYNESMVSLDAFEKVLAWKEGKKVIYATTTRERQIMFPKHKPAPMTEL